MTNGTTAGPNRMGREVTEESRKTTPVVAYNWNRVVDLVQTVFREGRLAE